ncbi:CoF synthetase [Paremcibacter congregatus]|uniref:CoF synthetase n=1 Tax=Paremcibacter congregatus TaxID=2043170 RepID=A0A2G4YR84_9PROT|nr:CoF synthetase [Paremcibacter congregatus]PHZ84839.1 CoF synthetase [Paremcibacter congregatus]QDE26188.1 CoF synthetase [Paremcibacter congregatus]
MKVKVFIKNTVSQMPYSIGKVFTHIPFSWRLGNSYTSTQNSIHKFNALSDDERASYLVTKLNRIIKHATSSFDFYTKLYDKHNLLGTSLKYLDDFKQFPIITKELLRTHIDQFNGALTMNTGGTTGEPFSFFLDKQAFSREWAHMHYIWKNKNYVKTDIKITLRGKNLGNKNIIYNPVHNEFIINTYKSIKSFKGEILHLIQKHKIKFVHGYPSAIYEFFKELDTITSYEEKVIIKNNLQCCFLGSEFPVQYMVNYLKTTWNLDYISWYGHSEMAILAVDKEKSNIYSPFMTYGYAEIDCGKLIGTSYNNFDMPMIRYDTGDKAEGTSDKNGILKNFSITEGREGDYIIDKGGKKIPLTALVFGRHHRIFDKADFIQVGQEENGFVIFYVTFKSPHDIDEDNLGHYFDLSNVDINFKFKIINSPIRSTMGKIRLKI